MNSVLRSSAEDLMLQDHQSHSLDQQEHTLYHPGQYHLPSVEIQPGKTEFRPRLSKEEIEKLENVFQENPKPSMSLKAQLAEQIGIERPRINSWFQNRRAKAKQERKQEEYQAQRAAETAVSETGSLDESTPGISESLHHNVRQRIKHFSTPPSSVTQLQAPTSPHDIILENNSQRGRTARRNMLATELTDSLRRELLWERQQKVSTQDDHQQYQSNENMGVRECVEKQENIPSGVSTNAYATSFAGHEREREFPQRQFSWIESVVWKLNEFRNMLSDLMQPRVASGHVRVSWTCRCGKRLHIEVPQHRQAAGIAFAQQASGSSNVDSVSYRSSDADDSSSTSSSTQNSEKGNLSQSGDLSLDSPSTAPSLSSDAAPDPFIPAGTSKYLLLCVNSGRRIGLANVDVTDVVDDEEVFKKLQAEYRNLRGRRGRNPLIKPKTMHYIKFQLLYLRKSKECVGNYEVNSIPSRTEIYRQEYAFSPCPPILGDLPIPPALFMHAFLDPGDHMGSMAMEMLPKKLRRELSWDASLNNPLNVPIGWGFYIVEGLDWLCVTWCIVITTLTVTLLTIFWSALMQDVQGGTGIGQYCIAVLAMIVSAALLATESPASSP
ncbi:hypothetical protein F4679DRAFT_584307 [Xylaria curta]|nr:hypothetical protein F4679DRAFT_584307 [Xylaria curta]